MFQNPSVNSGNCPNYFTFVVPEKLLKPGEIPDYAGLMYWYPGKHYAYGTFEIVKKAPKLHREKINPEQYRRIAGSLTARFWDYRIKQDSEITESQ